MENNHQPLDQLDSSIEIEEDSKSYSDNLGIRGIVLEQYRRCCIEGSKAMLQGGKDIKFIKGVPYEVEIPNQREVFVNTIKMLMAILTKDFKQYPKLYNEMAKLEKEAKQLETAYINEVTIINRKAKLKQIGNVQSYYSDSLNRYEKEMVNIYRDIFKILGLLLSEKNFYEEATGMGV